MTASFVSKDASNYIVMPTQAIAPSHWCSGASNDVDIMLIIYIGHISKTINGYQLTGFFVSHPKGHELCAQLVNAFLLRTFLHQIPYLPLHDNPGMTTCCHLHETKLSLSWGRWPSNTSSLHNLINKQILP